MSAVYFTVPPDKDQGLATTSSCPSGCGHGVSDDHPVPEATAHAHNTACVHSVRTHPPYQLDIWTIVDILVFLFCSHDNPAVGLATPYRQLHWLYLTTVNVGLLLSPSHLCADWTMGTVPLVSSLWDPRHLATVLCLCTLVGLGVYSVTRRTFRTKVLFCGLVLLVVPFLPASNLFFPVGFVVAERVLYLPSMGFCLLAAYGLYLLGRKSHTLAVICLVVIATSHTLKTLVRNYDWVDNHTLFTSAICVNPDNGKLYNNLGHAYEKSENFSHAEKLFRRASKVQPDDVGAFINLGRMLKQLNRPQEAELVR